MKKWFVLLLLAFIGQTTLAQDMIVKRNAEEVNGKILSVSTTEVEYRRADNPEGPVYKLPVADIFYIKYQNGTKDVFAEVPARNPKRMTGPGPVVQQGTTANEQPEQQNYEDQGANAHLEYLPGQHLIRHSRLRHHQERYPYYQGEITVAYGLGTGLASQIINTDRIALETVHGARLCPYFFVGGGVAFNYFYNLGDLDSGDTSIEDGYKSAGIIPVFANAKGYYPVSSRLAFYLSLDLGVAVPVSGWAKGGTTQFYTAVGPGVCFSNGKSNSHSNFNISIRFQHMGEGLNAVLFRLGFGF